MRVALTGTPGTGKTTVAEHVESPLSVLHLGDVVAEQGFVTDHDRERDSAVVDVDALGAWLADREDVLFESHLAHLFEADRVVVLRCHPAELKRRLEARGMAPESISENAQSEALDVVLGAAVDRHGTDAVYEIDTTDRDVESVTGDVEAVLAGEREPAVGTVSFVEYLDTQGQ
jgi:adenylate kinase